MTEHPPEGRIQAFLDEETDAREEDELRGHLAACPTCREELAELRTGAETVSAALDLLDPTPPTEAAWTSLQGRLSPRRASRRRPSISPLARAAVIAFLLVGGVVSALPGSPIREWVATRWDRWTEPAGTGEVTEVEGVQARPPTLGPEDDEVGAGVGLHDGVVELSLSGVPEGAQIRVLLVEGDRAGIFGPQGTHFRTEAGRLHADASEGGVRIEVPRGARRARVLVNGELYLRKTGDNLEILGPVEQQGGTEIRFRGGSREPGL